MKKRLLSIFLIVCLCAALLPTAALAADGNKWDGWTDLNSVSSYELTEGKYYLSVDLNLGKNRIWIGGDVMLDLNDHVLSSDFENDIITVCDGNLTLLDSNPETLHTITLEDKVGNTSVTKTIQGGVVHAAIINVGIGIASNDYGDHPALTLKGGTVFGKVEMTCGGKNNRSSTFYADGGTVLGEMDVGSLCKLTRHEDAADYTTFKGNVYVNPIDATVEDAAKIPVTFDANGGTFDDGAKSVKLHFFKGNNLGKPDADPTKAGCTFGGWYNGETKWDFDKDVVSDNLTLTAGWEVIPVENPDEQPDETPDGAAGLVAILDDVPFVDVDFNDYYYDSVKWAYHSGVTGGTDAWHFSPDAGCTRAQAVTFLWRAAGSPSASYLGNFADVDEDAYYAPAVAWAVANGVTNGTSATTFSPEAACSRGDIVTFLFRAFGGVSNGYHPFADVPASAYYADAVAWAYEHNVTGGTSADKFSPADACSRAQIVTFLYRVLG